MAFSEFPLTYQSLFLLFSIDKIKFKYTVIQKNMSCESKNVIKTINR